MRPFRDVDDTLGVVYTHGFAGLIGGLLVGVFATTGMGTEPGLVFGSAHLLGWQALTALWVIVFTAVSTYVILKVIGLVVPLRMSDADLEQGDLAVHGHEVYPSDVPSLGFPHGVVAPPAPVTAAVAEPTS
jgi:Amt family ammonium transporter